MADAAEQTGNATEVLGQMRFLLRQGFAGMIERMPTSRGHSDMDEARLDRVRAAPNSRPEANVRGSDVSKLCVYKKKKQTKQKSVV